MQVAHDPGQKRKAKMDWRAKGDKKASFYSIFQQMMNNLNNIHKWESYQSMKHVPGFFAFITHAERLGNLDLEQPIDPPISEFGNIQA